METQFLFEGVVYLNKQTYAAFSVVQQLPIFNQYFLLNFLSDFQHKFLNALHLTTMFLQYKITNFNQKFICQLLENMPKLNWEFIKPHVLEVVKKSTCRMLQLQAINHYFLKCCSSQMLFFFTYLVQRNLQCVFLLFELVERQESDNGHNSCS